VTPQQAFEVALREQLRQRGALITAAQAGVLQVLKEAQAAIASMLMDQPPDYKLWRLTPILAQINALLDGAGVRLQRQGQQAVADAWALGEQLVDAPLLASQSVTLAGMVTLPVVQDTLLEPLQRFAQIKLKDVTADAGRRIGTHLSLVTLGATTPYEGIQAVRRELGPAAAARAGTIVRTEVSRALGVSSMARLREQRALVPDLRKQWRKSGKRVPRENHVLMDKVHLPLEEAFKVPGRGGGVVLMQHPHDPAAPVGEVVNCGCRVVPFRAAWARYRGEAERSFEQPVRGQTARNDALPQRPLPRVDTPPRAAAARLEVRIRDDRLETGAFFGADGALLLERTGAVDRVSFTRAELSKMRALGAAVFTHNHPGSAPFSFADVVVAAESGVKELHAISPNWRYVMEYGAWTPPSEAALERLLDRWQGDLQQQLRLLETTDALDALARKDMGAELLHMFWQRLAALRGFAYFREHA
jgi:hypothetical protein